MIKHFYNDDLGTALGTDGRLVVNWQKRGNPQSSSIFCFLYWKLCKILVEKKEKLIIGFFFKRQQPIALKRENIGSKEEYQLS